MAPAADSPRILQIDDDADHAYLVRLAMERNWPEAALHHAESGTEAIRRLEGSAGALPDLILLDLRMPGMDGYDVLKVLQARDAWREIPVIVLTTANIDRERARASAPAVLAYLTKPDDMLSFRAMVEEIKQRWCASIQ